MRMEQSVTKLQYRAGDTVFRKDDPSEFVGRIISGEVEVVRETDGDPVVLGIVRTSEFIGEMGVIEGRPRSATVRALNEVTIELIGKDDFLKLVSADSNTAFQLLSRLSARLRETDGRLVEATLSVQGKPATTISEQISAVILPTELVPPATEEAIEGRLKIFAESERLVDQLPKGGMDVTKLPFLVGRKPSEQEAGLHLNHSTLDIDLQLVDEKPYRLSRAHFALQSEDGGGYLIRDLGSYLGTRVNDQFLGKDFGCDFVELNIGDNIIVAGGAESPFVFRISVEETQ